MRTVNPLTVNETTLVQQLSLMSGVKKQDVAETIKALGIFVMNELKDDVPVRLGRLGTFSTVTRTTRKGYNFQTKERVDGLRVVRVVKFKPSTQLKEICKL